MLVTLTAVVLFFVLPSHGPAVIALGAAAVCWSAAINPEKIYRQIDWSLLVMFAGLFIVVHAFQVHVVATGASRVGPGCSIARWTC